MHPDTAYETALPYIRKFAHRVRRRISGGTSAQFEDIIQELSIAWMTAARNWNPEFGVPFLAYLQRGMQQHVNQWANKEFRNSHLSMDSEVGGGDEGDVEEGVGHRLLADDKPTPAETVEAVQFKARLVSKLTPRARQFLELLENPPAELVAELQALRAKRDYAAERGIRGYIVTRVTAAMIFDLMGLKTHQRTQVTREIEIALERLQSR
jgi:DNA-directed RNA polymerase specialized sigma24 family protein